ncbi:hypothetical protein E2C01_062319 [Portunus trituberculatus]|uniref:Uncharacterized protein n=1 Tax=Portunus trituberculatus TaxID=210409 RepID=A0A5B7HHP7_PORTR|nr:hypothetical protein [Portunus trituberculatus]
MRQAGLTINIIPNFKSLRRTFLSSSILAFLPLTSARALRASAQVQKTRLPSDPATLHHPAPTLPPHRRHQLQEQEQ